MGPEVSGTPILLHDDIVLKENLTSNIEKFLSTCPAAKRYVKKRGPLPALGSLPSDILAALMERHMGATQPIRNHLRQLMLSLDPAWERLVVSKIISPSMLVNMSPAQLATRAVRQKSAARRQEEYVSSSLANTEDLTICSKCGIRKRGFTNDNVDAMRSDEVKESEAGFTGTSGLACEDSIGVGAMMTSEEHRLAQARAVLGSSYCICDDAESAVDTRGAGSEAEDAPRSRVPAPASLQSGHASSTRGQGVARASAGRSGRGRAVKRVQASVEHGSPAAKRCADPNRSENGN